MNHVLSTILNKRERERERKSGVVEQPCEIFIKLRDTRYTEYKIKDQFYHNIVCNTSLLCKAVNIFLVL